MSDSNKVKYGLKNVHYAIATIAADNSATFGLVKPWPGAVNLSMDAQGGSNKFRADNTNYYVSQSNNGYEGDLETAKIPDDFRIDVLGDYRDANGVLFENSEAPSVTFALLFEFAGDKHSTRRAFYNCVATRPSIAGQTTDEEISPQTETVTITASPIFNAATGKSVAQGKSTPDDPAYSTWYDAVYQPTNTPLVAPVGVAAEAQDATLFGVSVSDIQGSDVKFEGGAVTGTLKYLATGNAITNKWGAGNFAAIKFNADDWTKYTSVMVGLEPSVSSGLVEIKDDPDKNGVFKITNKATQVLKVVATDGTNTRIDRYNLSGLTLQSA